jgi:hypothetical protein
MQDLLERRLPLDTSLRDLLLAEKGDIEALFTEQFQEILDRWPGLKVNHSYGITFNRPHPDYSYDKDLMNLYFREKHTLDGLVDNIEPGYYSTNAVDDWELDRLEIMGQVIGRLRTVKQTLLERIPQIRTTYRPQQSEIYKQLWVLEEEEREQKKAIRARKLADGREYLFGEGLTFPEVRIEFLSRHSYTYGVVKATATKMSKNARTYKVTLLTKHGVTVDYERVREGALDQLIMMSNEYKAK